MNQLWYRAGGTARYRWRPVSCAPNQTAAKAAELYRMGYATVVAETAPDFYGWAVPKEFDADEPQPY